MKQYDGSQIRQNLIFAGTKFGYEKILNVENIKLHRVELNLAITAASLLKIQPF